MRLRACLGGLSLALCAACQTIPEIVKIEVDDRTIELKKKPAPVPAPAPAPAPQAADAEPQ